MYNNGEKILVNLIGEFIDVNDFKNMWVICSVCLFDIVSVIYEFF